MNKLKKFWAKMSFKSLLVPIYLWLFQKGTFVPHGEADIKRCPSKNDSNSDYCASSSQQPAHGFPLTAMYPSRSGWTRVTSVNLSPVRAVLFGRPASAASRCCSARCWGRGCRPSEGLQPPRMGLGDAGERVWCLWGRDGSGCSHQLLPAGNREVTETKCYQTLKLSQIYSEDDCEMGWSTPPGCPARAARQDQATWL